MPYVRTKNDLWLTLLGHLTGGIDLGLERAGMVCRWQVEIDDYCRRVLAKHWPDVLRYGDIREVDFDRVERVDLIAGGHPCQPDSLAGKGRGAADERWLWPEFARAIRGLRPQYVLVENPTGILRRGGGMSAVLGDLAALGYDAEWTVLSAAQFGAFHIRERVFILANTHGAERPERWFPPASQLSEAAAHADSQHGTARVGVRENASILAGNHGLGSDFWLAPPNVAAGVDDGVSPRLAGRMYGNAVVPQVAEFVGWRIVEADTP